MPFPQHRNRLWIFLLLFAGGCASDYPPSGGAGDTQPLQVISSQPAPESTEVTTSTIRLTFNRDISEKALFNSVHITPTIGTYDIVRIGKSVDIKPEQPFAANQTYTLTLDKQAKDMKGRSLLSPYHLAFSTGKGIDCGNISGMVFYADFSPASNALLLAFKTSNTKDECNNLLAKEPNYRREADASGAFAFQNIANGKYRIIATNDRNNDGRYTNESEEIGVSSIAVIPTGTTNVWLRFPKANKAIAPQEKSSESPTETGSITGKIVAHGRYVIIEAESTTRTYRTIASHPKNTTFLYVFPTLPAGSYTISAYLPSSTKTTVTLQDWNPGSIHPFHPADPFGFYPEKVRVRSGWKTENINMTIQNLR